MSESVVRLMTAGVIVLCAVGLASPSIAQESTVKREFIEPEAAGFTQVVTVEANGVKTIYVSGQTAPGETLEDQSKALYESMKSRLAAAGATAADVVKLTTYIVDYTPEKVGPAFAGFAGLFSGQKNLPAHTLIGVQALFQPEILMEVEAIAVVD